MRNRAVCVLCLDASEHFSHDMFLLTFSLKHLSEQLKAVEIYGMPETD